MDRVIKDYLIARRICPHQCASSLFRVIGSVDAVNKQMGLGLTWYDVVWMYECHFLSNSGYYLKSRSSEVWLTSCRPKSNKVMKDDFIIVSGEWHDGLHCPTQEGAPGGVP